MACSLNFSSHTWKIHQNSKKWWLLCEELLRENDFAAVLVNFCCYEYSVNASGAVQKQRLAQAKDTAGVMSTH